MKPIIEGVALGRYGKVAESTPFVPSSGTPVEPSALDGSLHKLEGLHSDHGKRVRVLHFNDLHGNYDRLAAIASLVKKIKRDDEKVLLVCAGDHASGSILFEFDGGELGLRILDQMECEALTIGNHEANAGVDAFEKSIEERRVRVLSANLDGEASHLPQSPDINPFTVVDVAGVRVGLFGLTTPEAPHPNNPKGRIAHNHLVETAQTAIDDMQALAEPPDLIVGLTHIGQEADEKLARQLRGCNLIVGGHSHDAIVDQNTVFDADGRPVPIVQAGSHGGYLGEVVLEADEDGSTNMRVTAARLHDIDALLTRGDIEPDAEVLALIKGATDRIAPLMRAPVLQGAPHIRADSDVRRGENHLTNLLADAVRHQAEQISGEKIDAALVNAGQVRHGLPAGAWRYEDIASAIGYVQKIGKMRLSGRQVREALERGVGWLPAPGQESKSTSGGLLVGSGLRYRYDAALPPGQRVESVEVERDDGWKPLADEESITVVVPEFPFSGGWNMPFADWLGESEMPSAWILVEPSSDGAPKHYLLRDMFVDYVQGHPDRVSGAALDQLAPRIDASEGCDTTTRLPRERHAELTTHYRAAVDGYADRSLDELTSMLGRISAQSRLPILRALRDRVLDADDLRQLFGYLDLVAAEGVDTSAVPVELRVDEEGARAYLLVDLEHSLLDSTADSPLYFTTPTATPDTGRIGDLNGRQDRFATPAYLGQDKAEVVEGLGLQGYARARGELHVIRISPELARDQARPKVPVVYKRRFDDGRWRSRENFAGFGYTSGGFAEVVIRAFDGSESDVTRWTLR